MNDFIVDEGVQIHGGMGYSAETLIERGYRDSRINRIFEGTNEINRMVTADTLVKKGQKGEIPIFETAAKITENLENIKGKPLFTDNDFENARLTVQNFKNVFLMIADYAVKTYGRKLDREQEILFRFANIIMETYVSESLYLRIKKLENKKGDAIAIYKNILATYLFDSASIIYKQGLEAIYSFVDEKEQDKYINALYHYTTVKPVNVKETRRRIADKLIDDNKYAF